MKKLLLLGGSAQQIVAIETAKKLDYYTILCDYLEDNPGQYYADKFYLASTTDKSLILKIAQDENIDGILAYASDPAAPTAAYVAEKMGLPGNPYESVDILCDKGKFRKFLSENGFNTPRADSYSDLNKALSDLNRNCFRYPVIVKPVDSSGSKGVGIINSIEEANFKINYAFSNSRCKRIIVEEYVKNYGYQVAGDGLSINGKLVFRCFANDHFNERCINPFVPIAASFPYNMPNWVQQKIHTEIQKLISLLGFKTSTYNFDIRIDNEYNVYLMEIAPRDGGNYIPQIIRYATGVDLVECSIKAAMGELFAEPKIADFEGMYAYYAIHSLSDGILTKIEIDKSVELNNVLEKYIVKKKGDKINSFIGSNSTLGILLMKFDSMEKMLYMMDHSEEWICVFLE